MRLHFQSTKREESIKCLCCCFLFFTEKNTIANSTLVLSLYIYDVLLKIILKMWSKKNPQLFWGKEQTKKVHSKSSLVAIMWSFLHWGAWDKEFDCTLLSSICKIMIYNHNFSFIGWLLLSKHRYFKGISTLEFSWHRANIKTAGHCMPFWSPSSFYNLYKLSWETHVFNFWCTMLSSDNF